MRFWNNGEDLSELEKGVKSSMMGFSAKKPKPGTSKNDISTDNNMNMNRSWTPPDNAKILPDMANILDAHALKKTSAINGMLACQLTTKQNVISRNRHHAERVLKEEKTRTANTLNQIQTKLPAVGRIRDFDMKFFGSDIPLDDWMKRKTKGYQGSKSSESICQRCYIHHLPLKKKFYKRTPLPPLSRNRLLPTGGNISKPADRDDNTNEIYSPSKENSFSDLDKSNNVFNFSFKSDGVAETDRRTPLSPAKPVFGWWMPQNKSFQFLKKDSSGRDIDVNKYYTPRLMPNEDWKNVVSDVCSRYSKSVEGLHTL